VSPSSKNAAAGGDRGLKLLRLAAERSEDRQLALRVQGNVIGIDLGVVGALALVSRDGDPVHVADMPVLRDGSGGRFAVNAPLLAERLARWHTREVVCEFVGARPKEGAVRTFSFGRSCDVIQGERTALGLPVRFLTAPAWKRAIVLRAGCEGAKDAARSEATRWPDKAGLFARVRDDDRADAARIAVAGLMRQDRQ